MVACWQINLTVASQALLAHLSLLFEKQVRIETITPQNQSDPLVCAKGQYAIILDISVKNTQVIVKKHCVYRRKTMMTLITYFAFIKNQLANFRIKTMFGSSLPPVVCRRANVLFTLYVFDCT